MTNQQRMSTKSPAKSPRVRRLGPRNSARSVKDHARQNAFPQGDLMHPNAILRIPFHKTILPLPRTVVWVLACSSLMFGQSPTANMCHMDSSGFCLADDTPNLPSSAPVAGTDSAAGSISTPQDEAAAAEKPGIKPKLEIEVRDGLLRIVAEHVSLRDVLKAISASTGAEVQFPMGALQEQVFVHLGLGTPQEVVRELLKGSHFNYVILSSNSDPGWITRLILSKAATGSNGNLSTVPTRLSDGGATPAFYGAAFGTDADSASVGQITPEPATAPASPLPSWVHHDGAVLSGEQLDQMQKAQIQQEQQQLIEQQKRQQEQDQAGQNPPQQ